LTGVLAAFPGGIPEQSGSCGREVEAPSSLWLGNGVIQRAVIKAFVAAGSPMGVSEAQVAVEALLGRPVSRDSVNSCLSTGARGGEPRFRRITRGRYELARPL
jgi:hypothetical protein